MLFKCAFLFAKIYTSETIMYLCFIGEYIVVDNSKQEKKKSLTKKEYYNLILEFDKSQEIKMTVEDLLSTNPQWSQRDRNFNIKFYRLVMNSLTNKQGS